MCLCRSPILQGHIAGRIVDVCVAQAVPLSWVSTPNRDKSLHRGPAGAVALDEEQSNMSRDCLIRKIFKRFQVQRHTILPIIPAKYDTVSCPTSLCFKLPCTFSTSCFVLCGELQAYCAFLGDVWRLICSEILAIKKKFGTIEWAQHTAMEPLPQHVYP